MPNIFNFEKISNYKSQQNPQFALPVHQNGRQAKGCSV